MFNPNSFEQPKFRRLPVILLLDVSGSMSVDGKIDKLHDAVEDMIRSFVAQAVKEVEINVAIFTFGSRVELHTPYTPVKELQANGIGSFIASGMTPLGLALKQAKSYIDDKEETKGSDYSPAVILVSDGAPNDEWENPLDAFITTGRSQKTQRIAVPIGADADIAMLDCFTQDQSMIFYAENASDIADSFKKVAMSISNRSRSKNPDAFATNGRAFDNSSRPVKASVSKRSVSTRIKPASDDDDDESNI